MSLLITSIRRGCLAVLLLLLLPAAHAQHMSFPTRELSTKLYGNQLVSGTNVLRVANDARGTMLGSGSFGNQVKYKSNYTLVRFCTDHGALTVPASPYVYKMAYQLQGCPSMTDSVYSFSVTDTLVVGYNPDSLTAYQDQQFRMYPNLYQAKLTIIGFYDITSGSPVALAMPPMYQNFFIELSMQYQPFVKTNYVPAAMALNTAKTYDAATRQLKLNWSLASPASPIGVLTPAQYELEWTYSDNYAADGGSLAASAVSYDFRNNATRVITDTPAFHIPVIYPRGYIAYRVRMLRVDSSNYEYPIYGPWSLPAASGKISSLPAASVYEITTAHGHDSLNWNYTIHFAESGKYKHVLSYYDGLLKNRQTITRFNSDPSRLLATEQIYDYEGRPAISTLPAVVSSTAFGYQDGLSISSVSGQPYSAADFDQKPVSCPDNFVLPAFSAASGANRYYSSLNTDTAGMQRFVPRANGYPFVHTRLSAGFSDRVERAGSAGAQLQVNQGHDIAHEYTGADQPDLNSLFGINAGVSSFYHKTMTRDQNGQYSMLVKDYRGRPVVSSLVGAAVDTNTVAMIFNDEVPNPQSAREDKLKDKTANITVGAKKIYNGNFYMDFPALSNVTYEYAFRPYQVCADPYIGLTVNCSYDFSIHDDCGREKVHRSGILGSTGLSFNPVPPPSVTSVDVLLDKGKHNLDKTLTIADDEVAAAVDSFFNHKPNCVRTEQDFIREAVERSAYPCEREDGCPGYKKAMMMELFTDAKYGKYRESGATTSVIGGSDDPDINSIYDIPQSVPDGSRPRYRYQNLCVSAALNALSITRDGLTYTRIGDTVIRVVDSRGIPFELRGDTVVKVFRDVLYQGDDRYRIAEALLPLHPEYCKLNICFEDTLAERLKAIPNSEIAEQQHLFSMEDIILKEEQLRNRMLGAPFYMTHIDDSLRLMRPSMERIDTFAAALALCMVDDVGIFSDARHFLGSFITNLWLPDRQTKDYYFEQMRTMYLGNRAKYVSMAMTGAPDDCAPCASAGRMKLIPAPLIRVTYAADGSLSGGPDGFLAGLSDSMRAKISGLLGTTPYTEGDTAGARRITDSARRIVLHADSVQSVLAVDSIVARMLNCFAAAPEQALFRDSLLSLVRRGLVHAGQFRPEQIWTALYDCSIPVTDICHPYLADYDYYDAAPGAGGCYDAAFYEAATAFFNSPEILSALRSAGPATSYHSISWPSGNLFADKVNSSLSGAIPAIYMAVRHLDSPNLYTLIFYKASGDSARFMFRGPYAPGLPAGSKLVFNRVSCFFEDPAAGVEGHVGRYLFRASIRQSYLSGADSVHLLSDYVSWNNASVQMNESVTDPLMQTYTYPDFRRHFTRFAEIMRSYGGFAQNHPLFYRSLRSYMNVALRRCYSAEQYERFLVSSALADSLRIPMYRGYGRISFPAPGFSDFPAFRDSVAAFGIDLDAGVRERQGSTETVYIDYGTVPYAQLRRFNTLLGASGGVLRDTTAGQAGMLWLPAGTDPARALAGSNFSAGPAVSVQLKRSPLLPDWTDYDRYTLLPPGSVKPVQLSRGSDRLDRNLYDSSINGVWLPAHFATINTDYYTVAKQQLLAYMYSNSYGSFYDRSLLRPAALRHFIPYFSTIPVTYDNPDNPYRFTDLYYTDTSVRTPGLDTARLMLGRAMSSLGGTRIFLPAATPAREVTAGVLPGASMYLYRCADGLYWYRYFGAGSQLYNVFIRVPAYIPLAEQPGLNLLDIQPDMGPTEGRSFRALLQRSGSSDTIYASGTTDFAVGANLKLSDVLLGNEINHNAAAAPLPSGSFGAQQNCEQKRLVNNIYDGRVSFYHYINSYRADLLAAFRAHVMEQAVEKLWIRYMHMRFGTTLYSYDLAGNLIRSVPPEGVTRLDTLMRDKIDSLRARDIRMAAALPAHRKASHYQYRNSNQPYREVTPDAGQKTLYYDARGNLVVSRSQEQQSKGRVSYYLYDGQNRLTETGQMAWTSCPYIDPVPLFSGGVKTYKPTNCACENYVDSVWEYCDVFTELSRVYSDSLLRSLVYSKQREQVVYTVYDTAFSDLGLRRGMSAQRNLRSRVAANMYYVSCSAGLPGSGFDHATHYSYDVAGNVSTLTHEFPQLDAMGQRFKRVDYEYDLLSGKVNMIAYNRGFADQFFQRYSYDADNRLTRAETSREGLIWKRDAAYTYYQHGPLARISLGEQRVQGVDYAYTLQGWLKAVNGELIDTLADMGGDGRRSGLTPKDAFATLIDYYNGDYQPIGQTPLSTLAAPVKNLYNGNIARQSTDLAYFGSQTAAYTYDQMNRLRQAVYAGRSQRGMALNFNNWYASAYRYDQDGNLTTLTRRQGSGSLMDSLSYQYADPANHNKLSALIDHSGFGSSYAKDIQGSGVVQYDNDGNTIKDEVNGADTLLWNIYGKATALANRNNGTDLVFGYDGLGQRTYKRQTNTYASGSSEEATYYVREASGNILADYHTRKTYNKGGRIPVFELFRSRIGGTAPVLLSTWLTTLSSKGILSDPRFSSVITAHAGATSLYPAGHYLAADPALRQQFISGGFGVLRALSTYSAGGNGYPVGEALRMGMSPNTAQGQIHNLCAATLGHPDPLIRQHALLQAVQAVPQLYQDFINNNQLQINGPGDSANLFVLMDNVGQNDPMFYPQQLFTYYQQQPALLDHWLDAVSSDSVYLDDPWSQPSGFSGLLENALVQYGDAAAGHRALQQGTDKRIEGLYGFASWWPVSPAILQTLSGPQLSQVAYHNDPISFLSAMGDYPVMDDALSRVEELDLYDLGSSLGIDMVPISGSWETLLGPALQQQEISLGSHHLYGSSRLGIARYWPKQYQSSWDFIGGSVTENGSRRQPWYSYAYNGLIDTGATSPWGQGLKRSLTGEHLLGQKQYELTNQLGNVQATVSDKRYVKIRGNDQRDYFNAGIVAAYDYYPYGMLMPGRYATDTADYCVTTTQTELVPWQVTIPVSLNRFHSPYTAPPPNPGELVGQEGCLSTPAVNALVVTPGVATKLRVHLDYIYSFVTITVRETPKTGGSRVLASKTTNLTGLHELEILPTVNRVELSVCMVSWASPGGLLFRVSFINYDSIVREPVNRLVQVCSRTEDKYPFGFNGQMKMNEVAGIGNWNTALYWEYETRGGTRKNRDPKPNPSMSPYSVFSGNPIRYADPSGDSVRVKGFVTQWDGKGNPLNVENPEGANDLWNAMLDEFRINGLADDAELLIKSANVYDVYFYTIQHKREAGPEFKSYYNGFSKTYNGTPSLFLTPNYSLLTNNNYLMSPLEITGHELGHAANHERNPYQNWVNSKIGSSTNYRTQAEEIVITKLEQVMARRLGGLQGQVTRTDHEGELKPTKKWWPGDSDKSPKERRQKLPNSSSSNQKGSRQGSVNIQIGDKVETYGGK